MTGIRIAISILLSLLILTLCSSSGKSAEDRIIGSWKPPGTDVVEMPIVLDSSPGNTRNFSVAPDEQRSPEFRKYLAPSVKISVNGDSGSGTIIYFDPQTGWAYIASCGHLWSGNRSYQEMKQNPSSAKVIVWYKNFQKLSEPITYDAEVLFWSNKRGYDSSCLRFKPDWEPDYFPIAPLDYKLSTGDTLHSMGCDGGREVAHYTVEFVELRGSDFITKKNSPRPGRSGGGLMTSDGWYIATCWGTSDTTTGGGIGYFTSLNSIHTVFSENEHSWLLEAATLAQRIPIRDWTNPSFKPDRSYIPSPGRGKITLPRF